MNNNMLLASETSTSDFMLMQPLETDPFTTWNYSGTSSTTFWSSKSSKQLYTIMLLVLLEGLGELITQRV